jgi:uncharacterized damage-inducible protein DinB
MATLAELTEAYLAGAAQLREAVKGMTREQAAARPVPGKWSTLECVAHVADFEPVYADRMKRVIALDKPLMFVADENEYVRHLAYPHRDLEEELALVEVTRKGMARILRHLPDSALQRTGVHNEKGLVTLADLLTSVTNHLTHHLRHIVEKKKALGIG